MADESHVVGEIVTKFFLGTCRLRAQLSDDILQAVAQTATKYPYAEGEADCVALITGSVAEFYVEPMLPHVGDVDVMFHYGTELAIPRGQPAPTQLPEEFSSSVQVYEIVDSHLPGYVYIELRYLLTKGADRYNYTEYISGLYTLNSLYMDGTSTHGPAQLTDNSDLSMLSVDAVQCLRCLSWPPQASDWPTRHRNYDWPDLATVDRVVSNGCDVVGVAHRQCKQHDWMGKHQ